MKGKGDFNPDQNLSYQDFGSNASIARQPVARKPLGIKRIYLASSRCSKQGQIDTQFAEDILNSKQMILASPRLMTGTYPAYTDCLKQIDVYDAIVALYYSSEDNSEALFSIGYACAKNKPVYLVMMDLDTKVPDCFNNMPFTIINEGLKGLFEYSFG